ncbi:Synphilin-1 [Geodia barretti]|nr:Synphilin-1 [Geodia barretti]
MSSRELSEYPGHEGDETTHHKFAPIQELDEGSKGAETTVYTCRYDDRKVMSINSRERQSSPKHLPHPHSPSSSSSGHSSPRSPPSNPPPPLPASTSGAGLKQQRPPHPAPSHAPRSRSHDILYSYHGDPNKAASNWKSSPLMQRGHTRASSDPKKQELLLALLTGPNERGSPSGPGSPQIPPHRHHPEPIGDHTPPRTHHSSRFSPEGIQAETGERRGGRGGGKMGGGKSSLASVSYDTQMRPGGVVSGVEGAEGGKEVIPTNHVALRVAQFSGSYATEEKEEGGGGRVKMPSSPGGNVRSPEMEKAKILTISPGSSEEELASIHSESGLGEGSEVTDGGYYHHKAEGVPPAGNFDPGHVHPQLSQPTYLNRAPPSSTSQLPPFPHNPASFPSLSQPHPSLSYETATHHRGGVEIPLNRSFPPPHLHQKHHPHTPYRLPPQSNPYPPPQSHDYHQRSHDHHMTGYPGSHDPHVTGYPGSSYEQHHVSPHHEHHVTSQHRSYRQQGHAHSQQGNAYSQQGHIHQRPLILKQNLLKAHEAAANGNLNALRHMLGNHEIDTLCMDDTRLTLAHTAAMTNNLSVLALLVNEGGLPLHALQLPDENLVSPAMVAIQNGCLEVLQWLVEEGKVPLVVQDAGGETLLHHAAHHGSANCLQWLLKVAKPPKQEELVEFLDNFGVTPAHFAAQQGHLECLQLMIDYNYSVITPDKENQKPIDWADAMNQTLCVRYLFMHETCWALSADVAHLSKQLELLQRENTSLKEKFSSQEQEYQQALGKIQTHHKERIVKIREQYVDLTASLLKVKGDSGGGGAAGGGASPKVK